MVKVLIDGQEYIPASKAPTSPRIGIAVTTHNRPTVLAKALENHKLYMPPGSLFVLIDDGSTPPAKADNCPIVRHEKSLGIVASKNASLLALMEAGCEHLFLFDDDAWPKAPNWWVPYVESPEPHLAYQFLDLQAGTKLKDLAILHNGSDHIAYTGQRGVMLYYHRSVIEAVGGFDSIYGRGMYEHSDLAMRIFHSGLTTWAFADVRGSGALIHSMDEFCEVKRSVPVEARQALVATNSGIHNTRRDTLYSGYAPYYPTEHAVISCLLTAAPDPQRSSKMRSDLSLCDKWAQSIRGSRSFLLTDIAGQASAASETVLVEPMPDHSPYFARWVHYYRFLRERKGLTKCWISDATDVEMLREPWQHMERGKIYVGSEPAVVGNDWMRNNHPSFANQDFISSHSDRPLLNAGLIGGHREDLMVFIHRMLQERSLYLSRLFWGQEKRPLEETDMALFNRVAYTHWEDRLETGPRVHTVFKTEGLGKEWAWWKHK